MATGSAQQTAGPVRASSQPAYLARAFGVAAALGAAIWLASPSLMGHPEPWDGNFVLYIALLFATGLASALITPRVTWAHYLGGVTGQFLVSLFFPKFEVWAFVAVLFVAVYSLVLWGGALVGTFARSLLAPSARRA